MEGGKRSKDKERNKYQADESNAINDDEKLCRVPWQIFVTWVISMHANGCNVAMTGLVIAGLRDSSSTLKMTTNEESWFASFFLIGSAIGTFLVASTLGHFGCKRTVIFAQILSVAGSICIVRAECVGVFYWGNFLAGCTNGLFLGVVPEYAAEISQPTIRKFTGSFLSVTFLLGFAITYLTGSLSHWRNAAALELAWPCIVILVMLACPESPTWLMLKGKKEIATSTLIGLRGNREVAMKELSGLENNLEKQKQLSGESRHSSFFQTQKSHLKIAMKGTFYRPCLVLTILLSVCWHWTGAYPLILHLVVILKEFEIPIEADWASAGLGVYQLGGALFGLVISFYVSRRKYYICSGICIFIGAFTLATVVHLKKYEFFTEVLKNNPAVSWIPFIALLIYFAGYSTGWVSVIFMLMGELLPSNGREMGCLIAVQTSNISSAVLVKLLPDLKELLGLDGLFWLFSAITIFAIIFVYFCVPETYGKKLEEIEEHYRVLCYPNQFGTIGRIVEQYQDNFNLAYTSD